MRLGEMGSSVLDPYKNKRKRSARGGLIFAFEDEIGEGEEGSSVFRVAMSV